MEADLLHRVRFEGNGGLWSGHNDYQLRLAMEQQTSGRGSLTFPLMYFATPVALDPAALGRDARRLEVWYAHHGWFDARFDGWRLLEIRRGRPGVSGVYDAIGRVTPGPRSTVRSLQLEGFEARGLQTVARTVLRTAALAEGDPFDLDLARVTSAQATETLQNHGRAYAHVDFAVDAHPAEQVVDVRYVASPGIDAEFGPITWEGLEAVPQEIVERAIRMRPGDQYRISELQRAQKNLFDLGLFSLVTLAPDLSDPSKVQVPVTARVTETRFRTVRAGAGLQYDAIALSPRVSASWTDQNLLGSLTRLELDTSFGYVFSVPSLSNADQVVGSPLFSAATRVSNPFLLGNKLEVAADLGVKQELQSLSLVTRRAEGNAGVVLHPDRDIAIDLGVHGELTAFEGESVDVVEGFANGATTQSYSLFAVDLGLNVDWRDDPINPKRGTYGSLDVRQAFGSFTFTRIAGDWRGYFPMKLGRTGFPFVWANRVRGRLVQPWGDSEIPYVERAFMGGSTSLRGFRLNGVGPYLCKCDYAEDDTLETRSYLPTGGTFGLEAASEVRYDWRSGISFSVFAEAGLLADGWQGVQPSAVRVGGGLGARYQSPIGPIRFDIGLRPSYPEDLAPSRVFGCEGGDVLPRAADLLRQGAEMRAGLNAGNNPPIAVNIFLAIGEAI